MSFSLDFTDFNRGLDLRAQTTNKTAPEIVNKATRDVAYRAASFTKVTAATRVRADLAKPGLLAHITAIRLRAKGIKADKEGFRKEMEKTKRLRINSVRYLRSGFAPIIRDLGGSFRGGRSVKLEDKLRDAQSGIHSSGKLATESSPSSLLIWVTDQPNDRKAKSAEAEVWPSFQRAVDFVAKDMIQHAHEKLAKAIE